MAGSRRTLISNDCPAGLRLVVRAEDDGEHYVDRSAPPGPIHPQTNPGTAFLSPSKCPMDREAVTGSLTDPCAVASSVWEGSRMETAR
jgi:hypothetical protein